ncbi:hypothetical protein CCP3SC1_570018 [Gammaproteobacteria bacterium]
MDTMKTGEAIEAHIAEMVTTVTITREGEPGTALILGAMATVVITVAGHQEEDTGRIGGVGTMAMVNSHPLVTVIITTTHPQGVSVVLITVVVIMGAVITVEATTGAMIRVVVIMDAVITVRATTVAVIMAGATTARRYHPPVNGSPLPYRHPHPRLPDLAKIRGIAPKPETSGETWSAQTWIVWVVPQDNRGVIHRVRLTRL